MPGSGSRRPGRGYGARRGGFGAVVGGGPHPQVEPKRVRDLLALEAVPRSQGEQLYEVSRLPQAPGSLLDGSPPHRAEKPPSNLIRTASGLSEASFLSKIVTWSSVAAPT